MVICVMDRNGIFVEIMESDSYSHNGYQVIQMSKRKISGGPRNYTLKFTNYALSYECKRNVHNPTHNLFALLLTLWRAWSRVGLCPTRTKRIRFRCTGGPHPKNGGRPRMGQVQPQVGESTRAWAGGNRVCKVPKIAISHWLHK